jgi:hypothetical protein
MANFNAHTLYNNDQLTDASTAAIILVIYPNGITKATYTNSQKLISITSITTDTTTQYMEEILFNELLNTYLLDNKELITNIYIAPEQAMMVPSAMHEPSKAEQWYRSIHFVANNHLIHQCPIDHEAAMYVMHYPKYLLHAIDTHFEHADLKPLGCSFMNTKHTQETLVTVHLHHAYCMLTHFEQGKVHNHQILHNHSLQEITQQLNIHLANANDYKIEVSTNDTNIHAEELIGSYFGEQMLYLTQHEFYQHLAACE